MAVAQDPDAADAGPDLTLRQQATEPIGVAAQVAILARKNFTLKARNLRSTLAEILIPVLALLLLMWLRGLVKPVALDHGDVNTPAMPFSYRRATRDLAERITEAGAQVVVIPAQNSALADTVAANLQTMLAVPVGRFDSNAALNTFAQSSGYGSVGDKKRVWAAISIDGDADHTYRYTLRMNVSNRDVPYHPGSYTNPFTLKNSSAQFQTYMDGFVYFQTIVDWSIVNGTLAGAPDDFTAQMFPQPAYSSDAFAAIAGSLIPLLIVFGYNYTITRVSKSLMEEKEEKIAEGLKIIGVSDTALFLSWLLVYGVLFALQSALITLLTKHTLFPNSSGLLIWLLFFLFPLSGIFALAYLMTPFFTRQRVASTFTSLVFLITTFVFFAVSSDATQRGQKLASSLVSSIALSHGLVEVFNMESNARGVTWASASEQINFFSMSDALGFLVLDFVLYVALGAYLTKVLPSTYGVPLPWNFFLRKDYWMPAVADDGVRFGDDVPQRKDALGRDVYDRPRSDATVSVSIRKLRCEFNNGETVAVNDLSLDMYRGEIFCLLGHNGAGKTTTISMLSGFLKPTAGDAMVFGNRVSSEMGAVRKSLGFCPQHDCLYAQLTVQEHLEMFGRLKGVPKRALAAAVKEVIETVGLTEKVQFASRNLSGGQKRKLSIGMALIGDSKLILLDEPTSGMDPYSRRSTWDLIKRARVGRTILLTTHFMDEADQLSDRIGIMAHGELQCMGSSLFLKRLFGVGYTLTVSKTGNTHSNDLITVVKQHVPEADVLAEVAAEISFRLPLSHAKTFPALFDLMDSRKKELGVLSYGVSVTTLSEVFLRVGQDQALTRQESELIIEDISRNRREAAAKAQVATEAPPAPVVQNLFFRHIEAMIWKRWHGAKRDRKVMLWQFIIPIVFIVLGVWLVELGSSFVFLPSSMSPDVQFPNSQFLWAANAGSSAKQQELKSVFGRVPRNVEQAQLSSTAGLMQKLLDDYPAPVPRYGAGVALDGQLTLIFNSSGLDSIPVYLNAIGTARLQQKLGSSAAKIELTSLPLPQTAVEKARSSTFLALILGVAFAFVPASFAAYCIRERETQVFQQQLLAGVGPCAYWISNWIWDFLTTLVPSYVCMIVVAAYGIDSLLGENAGPAILLLTLFSLAICPFTYLLSYLFKESNSGQTALLFLNIISVTALLLASIIMGLIDSTKDVNADLMYVYYLLPTYSMAYGILSLMSRSAGPVAKGIFDKDVLGKPLIYLACEAVGYFALLLIVEKIRASPDLLALLMPRVQDPGLPRNDAVDSDVEAEKARVKAGQADGDVIVLKGLRKVFPGPNGGVKVAVKDSWFGIPAGEVFGFLGVNGAGKTTTLQILSGDVIPTDGTAKLLGVDVLKDQTRARQLIGYCPQFDALIHLMTAREHLEMYAAFKGIERSKIKSTVQTLIDKLGLKLYADRPSGGYSGGNRRKLSVGIALVGDPPLVFLDEPSTGMDPGSRRTMWDVIVKTMAGKSVILTTHSMEECEALCTRIGIQVSGRLACLGTAQHLKDKFGNGYQLEINAIEGKVADVKAFVARAFAGSELLEEQSTNLKYRVPKQKTIGDMFRVVEGDTGGLVDSYSISDISLEQIFIYFASQQTEELGHVRGLAPMRVPSNPDAVVVPVEQV